jgi:hypothetical protein
MDEIPAEDSLNSVATLEGEISICRPRFRSYGGRTHESALIEELRGNGVGCYKPVYVERGRRPNGKARTWKRSVFPYKLFVGSGQRGRDIADRNHRVSAHQLIPQSGQARLKSQLAEVELHLAQTPDLYPELREGGRVRVRADAFMGREGTLENRRIRGGKEVFTVRLEIMGQSIPTDIDPAILEAA